MAALLRDAAVNLSRRVDGFEQLDHQNSEKQKESFGQRALSRRRNGSKNMAALFSVHRRRERAKQRQIFLRTYKLSAVDNVGGRSKTDKLKKVAVKVRRVVVSMFGFMRNTGSLRSTCDCRSAICVASPTPIRRCC
ncbi:hypothetical protein SLE2022_050400 [Rubroshorea leprosula]